MINMLPVAAALAAVQSPLDYDRLILCLIAKEATPWHHAGGALGYTRATWEEDTHELPYSEAGDPDAACTAAKVRFAKHTALFKEAGITASVYDLASAWRHGFDGALRRIRERNRDDYATCVVNLYRDKAFPVSAISSKLKIHP